MGPDVSRAGRRAGADAPRRLRSAALADVLSAVADALAEHREEIDALNVFPVPDGDTGSNLATTAEQAARAARADVEDPGQAAVRAALRAARGNSGVIYSQVVAAAVEAITSADPDDSDLDVLAAALDRADEYARRAVADPVEGTILTALREAGASARRQADAGADLVTGLEAVLAATQEAVTRTEHQLDVLERAGVVDAGARGLAVVMAAVLGWARSGRRPTLDTVSIPRCLFVQGDDDAPYEVQYVVTAASSDDAPTVADELRTALAEVGESVVVVAAGELVSAHVHTDDTDAAVRAADGRGALSDLRITDLREPDADPTTRDRTGRATVAIVPAGGLADLLAGGGAHVVEGAAGELPPAGAVADAIVATGAAEVLVLPGHPNAVPACRQAASLAADEAACDVTVLDDADHPLRALIVVSLGETASIEEARTAVAACTVGEVVEAERDGAIGDLRVASGQWVALAAGVGVAAEDDALVALRRLVGRLVTDDAERVTVAAGHGVDGDELGRIAELLAQTAPQAESEVLATGQRPARYLVAVE